MENIVIKNVTKKYGDKEVVKNMNFTLEKGKIYGLIGRNGAGKTTLLSMISSQNPITEGNVTWNDKEVWENKEALGHICFSREINIGANQNSFAAIKIKDYLKTAGMFFPNWDKEMADKLVKKFELDPKQKLGKLSKGMLSMVTIIVAMASKADFTFLDEPVAGLDVVMREFFYKLLIDEFTKTGRTFVVSTHIIEEAADIFEEVIIIDKGELLVKENTLDLLERAYQINGLASTVDEVTKGFKVYNEKTNGRAKNVTVLLEQGESISDSNEVTVSPVNLQSLFVALCGGTDLLEM